ncbi:MAG: translation initiation factor [Bacteriovoracaceae bacterium]|nr:translation initiation factor [Bacteriovoracaceae bacterium]
MKSLKNLCKDYELVYSDDPSELKKCKSCKENPCTCRSKSTIFPKDITLKIRLEKNGRGGKLVTVIFYIPSGNENYFLDLTKKLKNHCGTGGSFKDGSIEIQGDHREKLKIFLGKLGFQTKFAGG